MSLLTGNEIHELLEKGVIQDADPANINSASLDIRLGGNFKVEARAKKETRTVYLARKEAPQFHDVVMMEGEGLAVLPGQFLLAHTVERFYLPDGLHVGTKFDPSIAAEFKLRSSVARGGLNHALAGWGDPGFHDADLTLELKNWTQFHTLVLEVGMRIGQLVFWRGAPISDQHSYATKGTFNGQRGPNHEETS